MAKIRLIDGNNQFFLKYAKATSYKDLVNRCKELHWGFDQVWWVFDGYDSRKSRRDLYPEYKNTASRAKNKLDTTKYDMLNDFKKIDLPAIGGVMIVERAYTEADDLIRALAIALADGVNQIEITSNDVDLLNLSYLPNVTQPQAKLPKNVNSAQELDLFKTLVGDSSDNLKGLAGFGEAAWAKLTGPQRVEIKRQLDNDQESFLITPEFNSEDKYESKVAEKIHRNWDTIKMYFRVVNYIPVDSAELLKSVKAYPMNNARNTQAGALLTMD